MVNLLGIIALHMLVMVFGHLFKKKGPLGKAVVVLITLFIVAWVAFGMYTMEMPETKDAF